MTDCAEEQENELAALQSIYIEEFEEIGPGEFRIRVTPDEQDTKSRHIIALKVKFTPRYPEELPEFEIENIEGELSPEAYRVLKDDLSRVAEDSLGMAMTFTLASHLQEHLSQSILHTKRQREQDEANMILEEIEKDQAKFRGTKVTPESFLAWKLKFDQDMSERDDAENKNKKIEGKNKPTGRQLFELDRSLVSSDAKYADENDIVVDLSSFEREIDNSDESDDEANDENAVWKQFAKAE